MASATGLPQTRPDEIERVQREDSGLPEEEPLLGRPGDACLPNGQPLYRNLYLGTAPIAQAGGILLFVLVWASVFLHPLSLFSFHPLLNSTAILLSTQAILILQPTHTTTQKRRGTLTHASLNTLVLSSLIAALVVIEYNKFSHKAPHFTSVHGKLGLITYVLLFIQAFVGLTQYFVPQLYGGVENGKKLYKWHRLSGYVVLMLMLSTVVAATYTYTGEKFLQLKTWPVVVAGVLALVGILPRVRLHKFGYLTEWLRTDREVQL